MSDAIEINWEDLELKKPLAKMTSKELRQLCMDKLPMITGASRMDKDEIIAEINSVFGFTNESGKENPYKGQIRSLKRDIRSMREDKKEVTTRKERCSLRRKINKLKKRTRRLAASA